MDDVALYKLVYNWLHDRKNDFTYTDFDTDNLNSNTFLVRKNKTQISVEELSLEDEEFVSVSQRGINLEYDEAEYKEARREINIVNIKVKPKPRVYNGIVDPTSKAFLKRRIRNPPTFKSSKRQRRSRSIKDLAGFIDDISPPKDFKQSLETSQDKKRPRSKEHYLTPQTTTDVKSSQSKKKHKKKVVKENKCEITKLPMNRVTTRSMRKAFNEYLNSDEPAKKNKIRIDGCLENNIPDQRNLIHRNKETRKRIVRKRNKEAKNQQTKEKRILEKEEDIQEFSAQLSTDKPKNELIKNKNKQGNKENVIELEKDTSSTLLQNKKKKDKGKINEGLSGQTQGSINKTMEEIMQTGIIDLKKVFGNKFSGNNEEYITKKTTDCKETRDKAGSALTKKSNIRKALKNSDIKKENKKQKCSDLKNKNKRLLVPTDSVYMDISDKLTDHEENDNIDKKETKKNCSSKDAILRRESRSVWKNRKVTLNKSMYESPGWSLIKDKLKELNVTKKVNKKAKFNSERKESQSIRKALAKYCNNQEQSDKQRNPKTASYKKINSKSMNKKGKESFVRKKTVKVTPTKDTLAGIENQDVDTEKGNTSKLNFEINRNKDQTIEIPIQETGNPIPITKNDLNRIPVSREDIQVQNDLRVVKLNEAHLKDPEISPDEIQNNAKTKDVSKENSEVARVNWEDNATLHSQQSKDLEKNQDLNCTIPPKKLTQNNNEDSQDFVMKDTLQKNGGQSQLEILPNDYAYKNAECLKKNTEINHIFSLETILINSQLQRNVSICNRMPIISRTSQDDFIPETTDESNSKKNNDTANEKLCSSSSTLETYLSHKWVKENIDVIDSTKGYTIKERLQVLNKKEKEKNNEQKSEKSYGTIKEAERFDKVIQVYDSIPANKTINKYTQTNSGNSQKSDGGTERAKENSEKESSQSTDILKSESFSVVESSQKEIRSVEILKIMLNKEKSKVLHTEETVKIPEHTQESDDGTVVPDSQQEQDKFCYPKEHSEKVNVSFALKGKVTDFIGVDHIKYVKKHTCFH